VSADERLAEAIALRESGKLEQALPLLLALRQEFPDDARIAVQTAWTHDSLGLEEEAAGHYEAAIRGDLTARSAAMPTPSGSSGRESSGSPISGRCASSTRCSTTTSAGRGSRCAH
jgi:tetratricopeptide (TPR) repeat protein